MEDVKMNDYVILTDSSCDLPDDIVKKYQLEILQLDFIVEGEGSFHNDQADIEKVYSKLRNGANIKTSAANISQASEAIEALFNQKKDILYLGFSSGLSSTYQTVYMAGRELMEEYPERKMISVDTLAASMGQGLLVYKACQAKDAGKSLEENAQYIEDIKLKLCHWFTVDDLFFLKRGGRISGVTATVGTMLSIKPILHVDDEGHLINVSKVRGRKAAITELVNRMEKLAVHPEDQDIFISHGDCIEDAEKLASIIKERFGNDRITISYVGPVIGAHSGPGTLALFFLGEHR
ncbi:MAG: DegV family protein [Clostridium sp.]|nr:DegV family protein [Clostridium sp.]